MTSLTFAFFGTGALAESVLASLVRNGYTPALIVTKADAPSGRHMEMKSPHIKTWGDMKSIPVFQPNTLKNLSDSPLHAQHFDLFVVASYGKIIPQDILNIPSHGVLNVHPSLLPEYRGPSPIESVLLDGKLTTGVTIIKLDELMDHGPILAQTAFIINANETAGSLEVTCGQLGGNMLSQLIPSYIEGVLIPKEQDHTKATLCKKIEKSFGEITLNDSASEVQRKYRGLTPWPGLYFFHTHHDTTLRIKITKVDTVKNTTLDMQAPSVILSVVPEGKKEMSWESFVKGYIKN